MHTSTPYFKSVPDLREGFEFWGQHNKLGRFGSFGGGYHGLMPWPIASVPGTRLKRGAAAGKYLDFHGSSGGRKIGVLTPFTPAKVATLGRRDHMRKA